MPTDAVSTWFVREILPFEALLMQYLSQNWKNPSDLGDLRQEIYIRVFEAAQIQIPDNAKRFLLITARNFLIDLVRHEQVVPIVAVADLDTLGVALDLAGPDRETIARDELRRLEVAVDRLPPRLREAFRLAYVEGLTGREIAARMGVTKSAASKHLANGVRALLGALYGPQPNRSGKP